MLICIAISIAALQLLREINEEITFQSYLEIRKYQSISKSVGAKNRIQRNNRMQWSVFSTTRLNDRQFRRYFHMPRGCFDQLCETMKNDVGEKAFKSEKYWEDLKTGLVRIPIERKMYIAHSKNGSEYLCGEVKVAFTLRMLAGGSYLLDLFLIFNVYTTSTHPVLKKHVVKKQINSDAVADINGTSRWNKCQGLCLSLQFFTGCIGALDCSLVRIWSLKVKDGG